MLSIRPPSRSSARSANRCTFEGCWVTSTMRRAAAALPLSSKSFSHLRWNAGSPTASTSSSRITSASTWFAIENARRARIPDE